MSAYWHKLYLNKKITRLEDEESTPIAHLVIFLPRLFYVDVCVCVQQLYYSDLKL